MFDSEAILVDSFVEELKADSAPWQGVKIAREFDYQRGRTDVLALTLDGTLVAFEAKLTRWKQAVQQAYRNRCFANASFVVLPKSIALKAAAFGSEFRRRGVGLCYMDRADGVVVLHEPTLSEPLQPWLRDRALGFVLFQHRRRVNFAPHQTPEQLWLDREDTLLMEERRGNRVSAVHAVLGSGQLVSA